MTRCDLMGTPVDNFTYDAENRMTGVSGSASASFVYDGDGARVKGTVSGAVTAYVSNWFEWTGSTSTMKKYYYAGAQRIAMRTGSGTGTSGLLWMIGDHLGSTTKIANADGSLHSQRRYRPWGEARFGGALPTTYRYTGQRQEDQLGGADGLYYYGARWYDAYLNRWTSPDPIIPDPTNPLDWDRYGYCRNNPLKYVDDSGNIPIIPLIIGIVIIGSKLIDYGWTASDMYQSGQVLADPNASDDDKLFTGINISLAALFEGGKPDDFLPAGIPLDDIGRRALIKGMKEAYAIGGEEALERFIRENLGEYADDVLAKFGFGDNLPGPGKITVLQTGGHTLSNRTLQALGMTKDQGKRALEALKADLNLPHNFHGRIMSNGDYVNPRTGRVLGNLKDYVP